MELLALKYSLCTVIGFGILLYIHLYLTSMDLIESLLIMVCELGVFGLIWLFFMGMLSAGAV